MLTSKNLLRQFLTVRTEVIGPVLTKIWDTPESTRTERMKHVIEPTFAVDYTTEFANQSLVPNTNDEKLAMRNERKRNIVRSSKGCRWCADRTTT